MAPKRGNPEDPQEWLRHARSNLAMAKGGRGIPDVFFEHLCFDAQQAAEKAIKAVYVSRRMRFPKTHDLLSLLDVLERAGVTVPEAIRQADRLNQYAVETRYPNPAELSEEHYIQAVELAERVLRWAESQIATKKEP